MVEMREYRSKRHSVGVGRVQISSADFDTRACCIRDDVAVKVALNFVRKISVVIK
jgi:hypothetical protein